LDWKFTLIHHRNQENRTDNMTRLKKHYIVQIAPTLEKYDEELREKTGCTLRQIAAYALDFREPVDQGLVKSMLVAVIPLTCGQGVIDSFAYTVKEIVRHIGFNAFVTNKPDVEGLCEAFERKASVIMVADDNRFVAINLISYRVVDNAVATGRGYAAGLNQMASGLKGQKVLVIGCGRVGCAAAGSLIRLGAEVSVYDIDQRRCNDLMLEMKRSFDLEINVEEELGEALVKHRRLIDASTAANIIGEEQVFKDTFIAAPGIPHGLTSEALKKISDRLLHDPLQIGVATMAIDIAATELVAENSHRR